MPTIKPLLKDERKRAAAILLAEGKPINEVAKAAQVNVKTLYLWRKHDEEFKLAFSKELFEMQQDAIAGLHKDFHKMVQVVHDIAMNPDEKAADRLKAVELAAKLIGTYHQQDDFKRRLAIADAVNQYNKYQTVTVKKVD